MNDASYFLVYLELDDVAVCNLQKKGKNTNGYKDNLRIENKDIDAMSAALLLLPTKKMVKLFIVKK